MNKVITLFLLLSTVSCSLPQVKNPMNVKALLPVGSTLRLTKKIIIPEDRSFIYIANGKVAPLKNYNTVDVYQPHCMFYLDKEASYERQVLPDIFKVTNIIEMERDFAMLNSLKAVQTFNRTDGMIKRVAVGGHDGGPSIVKYATIISLHSDKQAHVKKIVCGYWDDPHEVEPLTLKEMKSALGDLILIDEVVSNVQAENNFRLYI